eukprot:COSAG01_NODE_4995_length_4559_cov_6.424439_2_plen_108_part_00
MLGAEYQVSGPYLASSSSPPPIPHTDTPICVLPAAVFGSRLLLPCVRVQVPKYFEEDLFGLLGAGARPPAYLMTRRGCSLPANASGFDPHRASITSRFGQGAPPTAG